MLKLNALLILLALSLLAAHARAGDEGTFDSDGVTIRYVTEGEGEPVLLIHGWMADSSMWGGDASGNTKLTPLEGFQLIALDCRGHGQSDKPHEPDAYGPAMAQDVVRLLDHLKIDKAHLVGYSMGAFIAGHVAANHPDRVISVVFGGQAPLLAGTEPPTDGPEVTALIKAVEADDLGAYILAVRPPTPTTPDRPKLTPEQASLMARFLFYNKDPKALAAAGQGFKHLTVTEDQLRACTAPVLFIHGENEAEHVRSHIAAIRDLLGRGEIKIIEAADHMTTLTKPDFGAAIVGFLRSNRQTW